MFKVAKAIDRSEDYSDKMGMIRSKVTSRRTSCEKAIMMNSIPSKPLFEPIKSKNSKKRVPNETFLGSATKNKHASDPSKNK